MNKIKWEARAFFGPKIRKVEVVKETKGFVWLKEDDAHPRLKKAHAGKYYGTFEEAKRFLLEFFTNRAAYHRHCLAAAEKDLNEIEGMKGPDVRETDSKVGGSDVL